MKSALDLPRTTRFGILPVVNLAFLDDHLFLLVSRTPHAITDCVIGLREFPDNPVLTIRLPARLHDRPQSYRLSNSELGHSQSVA